ncbi:MAG: imidazole glycerol phosphate synthase subunit HisH [Raineya sp.]|jgi:glutamine amidotransferase|nr:imidazole glycerol phosphate synthase subunit HisH [Raineya sp.]
MSKVIIVDYQAGNLFSVLNACLKVGINAEITSDKNKIVSADGIILPGVGAFGESMNNLEKLDLVNPIKDFVSSGKPFLGVCLGLQLLFEESEEFGVTKGLGLVEGVVKKFKSPDKSIKIPQIGWNTIQKPPHADWQQTPLTDIAENSFMYFVHSFYVEPSNHKDIISETTYEGKKYCSSIQKNNIFATQFHPEKSADLGLRMYKNWSKELK